MGMCFYIRTAASFCEHNTIDKSTLILIMALIIACASVAPAPFAACIIKGASLSRTLSSADWARADFNESPVPSASDNAYFLELDRLLARIETATTYYQALGVGRDLSREQLDQSFSETLAILYPAYRLSAMLPAEMLTRIERAFNKAAQGFS